MMKTLLSASALLAASLIFASAHAQESSTAATATESEVPAAQTAPQEPTAEATPIVAEPTTPASSEFSPAVLEAIGRPAEGKALVVFFRPSKMMGAAIGFKVREGEVELGKLRNGKYFTANVDPGNHVYVVHSEAKDVTTTEVEAGETYFLSGSVSMGFMAGRPNLSPSDAAAFEAALPKLKLAKPLD